MSEREIPYAELRERMERTCIQVENKDTEIKRWKDEYLKLDEKLEQALRKNENQATLITELSDALRRAVNILSDQGHYSQTLDELSDPLQRAREATKDE